MNPNAKEFVPAHLSKKTDEAVGDLTKQIGNADLDDEPKNGSKTTREDGDSATTDLDEDDRHLLRAGENYCEFNGEQFIIPGEDNDDDQYEEPGSDNQTPAGYDFGNVEDNEDEDVCNAYEEFLNELP